MQDLPTGWASIYSNYGLISLSTSSGYRSSIHDPEGEHIVVGVDIDDDILGRSLLSVLKKSESYIPMSILNFMHWLE